MAHPRQSIAEQLAAAELAISVSLSNAEIQTLVGEAGYTAEKLQAARVLYQKALDAWHAQKDASGARCLSGAGRGGAHPV